MRLRRYEDATSTAMVVLAAVYLIGYAVEVIGTDLPNWVGSTIEVLSNTIWIVFALDLLIRLALAPRRLQYLLRHPLDVVAVVVPMFRFLRILRVITAGQWLISRGRRLAVGRTAMAILVAVGFLALVGALAILDAESGAPDARITNFGDAIWWAFTTMSTVGYGDMYPVTPAGRVVAIGMMTVGVSLLGIISATLAAGFLAQTRVEQESENAVLLRKLEQLEVQIGALSRKLAGDQDAPGDLESPARTETLPG